ncbi:hypothetical protein LCGC14_1575670, partial [marine sediment metagenome]
NRPPGSIVTNYDRSTPIIKFGESKSSIERFGPKEKVIQDKNIIDPDMAKELRDERNSFSAFGRRTVPDVGPYAGDLGRALWFENSALYQAAKRRIAEEPTPEEKEEKRLATRAGELRRRPPRFAAIRQV